MTSPDFMYPQPTDDELAAQQPRTPALGGGAAGAVSLPGTGRSGASTAPGASAASGAARASIAADSGTSAASAAEASIVEENRQRLGKAALVVAIVAAGLSLISSIILGATIGPMQASSGYHFTDTPGWYQNLAFVLFGLQALGAALGITGLVMGIVSAVTGRSRTQGIVAMTITILAPFVSFAVFMVLSFTSA
ncbi:hypothetical protein [Brevibacterium marinum]|uniref:Uncharacterized protein n=1 Tax=Brevibacterium marinum TaxID=418643 RepID=A0A846RX12_9MICO|nr:hypothetical protein [Brevibacterium marinum]NJC55153.1 hypothetical protein [Brevibacterium marinum]